jgi:hypothetical protein
MNTGSPATACRLRAGTYLALLPAFCQLLTRHTSTLQRQPSKDKPKFRCSLFAYWSNGYQAPGNVVDTPLLPPAAPPCPN